MESSDFHTKLLMIISTIIKEENNPLNLLGLYEEYAEHIIARGLFWKKLEFQKYFKQLCPFKACGLILRIYSTNLRKCRIEMFNVK